MGTQGLKSEGKAVRRTFKRFTCWRCGKVNPDYLAFRVGLDNPRYYCLNHIPRRVRLRMWIDERLGRS